MRNKLTTILLVLAFFAGLSLLLYPTVSDYWNSLHASQAVADYAEKCTESRSREIRTGSVRRKEL